MVTRLFLTEAASSDLSEPNTEASTPLVSIGEEASNSMALPGFGTLDQGDADTTSVTGYVSPFTVGQFGEEASGSSALPSSSTFDQGDEGAISFTYYLSSPTMDRFGDEFFYN
jgi:hypothetical protein